jgi:hypothetical protein
VRRVARPAVTVRERLQDVTGCGRWRGWPHGRRRRREAGRAKQWRRRCGRGGAGGAGRQQAGRGGAGRGGRQAGRRRGGRARAGRRRALASRREDIAQRCAGHTLEGHVVRQGAEARPCAVGGCAERGKDLG